MAAVLDIAARVKLNPNVSDREPAVVDDVVRCVEDWLTGVLNMPEGIRRAKAYSLSGVNAAEDVSGLESGELWLGVNGFYPKQVTLDLAGLTTGAAIASALQTAIRALDAGTGVYEGITVSFDGETKQYRIEGDRYGRGAYINVNYQAGKHHLARALQLSPEFGGTEAEGAWDHQGAQSLAVDLATRWFRQIVNEGNSDRVPSKAEVAEFYEDDKVRRAIEHIWRL